jgi:salicylate hydroxylase
MAIEDAAALGILFNETYFSGDVAETLRLYQEIRLPRATKVQAASAKAAYNINERIGFSSNTNIPKYKVEDEKKKLTIEEMNAYDMYKDIEEVIAQKRGIPFMEKFMRGLPIGLKLSNGVTVGEEA